MTMALSGPLQIALFDRLSTAPELSVIAGRVYDEAPHRSGGDPGEVYVTLGDESVRPWNTATEQGALHDHEIRVCAPRRGFLEAKEIAAAITAVIEANPPSPSRGAMITHEFLGAKTRREEGGALRRVDLSFRFVIEDTPAI